MRMYKYNQLNRYIELFSKIHTAVYLSMDPRKFDLQGAVNYLVTCQQKAIELGTIIETDEGENHPTVKELEAYCEKLYEVCEAISSENSLSVESTKNILESCLTRIEKSLKEDIKVTKLVVFLPYKASMWDSLEGFYLKEAAKEDVEAVVIPIPYYDKNPDGSCRNIHYEGEEYPKNIPIVSYEKFDFSVHPDEIYIHNPYDDCNYVTTVPEFFFSNNLKNYTDNLIYVPYFVLGEPDVDNPQQLEGMKHFALIPGVINADHVIVQSENMKKAYVRILTKQFGQDTESFWDAKISGEGSAKIEKAKNLKKENQDIPREWADIIYRPDGTAKKIIFYNNSVTSLLDFRDKMLTKLENSLKIFYENREKIALLWRPHPLMEATLVSMEPELWEKYKSIVENYKKAGWGIYDDTADMDRALALADAYYGDPSSLVQLCETREIPVMIQNVDVVAD